MSIRAWNAKLKANIRKKNSITMRASVFMISPNITTKMPTFSNLNMTKESTTKLLHDVKIVVATKANSTSGDKEENQSSNARQPVLLPASAASPLH